MVKKILIMVLAVLSAMPAFSTSENTLVADDINTASGEKEVLLTVKMNNTAEISDLQFDLTLPEGFSIALDEDDFELIELNTSRTTARKHNVDFLAQSDGSMRIMCSSTKGYTFSGTEGGVIDIYLNVGDNVTGGAYTATLTNIVLSNAETTFYGDDTNITLTIPGGDGPNPPVEDDKCAQ